MANLHTPVTKSDYIQGPEDALVTLVEYGDYECIHCGHAYLIVKEIQKEMGDSLRFVFRNFPLNETHAHAQHAAEAAEIAGTFGLFWEMHDMLFDHQDTLQDDHLREYAHHIGIEREEFVEHLIAHSCAEQVTEDFESGIRSGVNGTPTFFINGIRYDGSLDTEDLREAIDRYK
jgi:protein-disulfide isomerase